MGTTNPVWLVVALVSTALLAHLFGWLQGLRRGIRQGVDAERRSRFSTGGTLGVRDPDVPPIGCARAEVVRGTGHGAEVDRLVLRGVAEGFAMHRLEFGGGGITPDLEIGIVDFLLQEVEESRRVFPNDQLVTLGQHHEEPISTAYPKLAAARARVDAVRAGKAAQS